MFSGGSYQNDLALAKGVLAIEDLWVFSTLFGHETSPHPGRVFPSQLPPPRFLALPCRAQTKPAAAPKKKSFWVGPQTGSNIARGFVEYDSGESTVEWPTEDASLAGAVKNLEARSGTLVDGRLIVWDVVSQQTSVPVSTLQRQNAETRLGAGELLVANSLGAAVGRM